ncbi:YfgM family protein [Methylogaea oryzae]|uniref:Ancillary SecYEG translocon subunit n=1 Tax=Methylogaea oryzae TaxID=1295382 RepID=A0A8D5AHY7_9GAMM|nr:tetratricopeptide repeat protein [Methylogaea oryzae]BBL71953.1 hypothetical protein MoryE10_25590 [Methylogaea oryzae]
MEIYHSEEEQLEAIKRWWKENGPSAIVGVAIGAALILGYNLWQDHRRGQSEQASALYQEMVKATESKQIESAEKLNERIAQNYDGTVYATFARLAQAKLKADGGDMAAARRMLEAVLSSSVEDKFKHIARIRLGQVLLEVNEAPAALDLVEKAQAKGFGAFERDYELLKGDIYSALNRRDEARVAYQAAQRLGAASAALEMKLDEFGGAQEPAH